MPHNVQKSLVLSSLSNPVVIRRAVGRGKLQTVRKGVSIRCNHLAGTCTYAHPLKRAQTQQRRDCSVGFSIGINVVPFLSALILSRKGSSERGNGTPLPKGLLIDFRSSSLGLPPNPLQHQSSLGRSFRKRRATVASRRKRPGS